MIKNAENTSVALKSSKGVAFCSLRKLADKFIEPESVTSIYKITSRISAIFIGYKPDFIPYV